MTNCPCVGCLCYAICREKPYIQMFNNCCLVKEFMDFPSPAPNPLYRDSKKLKELEDVLKPICWKTQWNTFKGENVLIIQWTREGLKRNAHPQ